MLERPTTWKKLSAISQSSARPGEMVVRYERSYHMQDEDETEVEAEDAVKGNYICVTLSLFRDPYNRLQIW